MPQEQTYECKICKKLTTDKKLTLKGLCALCRLKKLKTKYMHSKLETYNKFELNQEIKIIMEKLGDETDSDDFSDNI